MQMEGAIGSLPYSKEANQTVSEAGSTCFGVEGHAVLLENH